MTGAVIDDDDWQDLERSTKYAQDLPDVAIRVCFMGRKTASKGRATARIVFRRRAAELILGSEPRFRIQIGGPKLNKIRIIKDHEGGSHECFTVRGGTCVALGHVNVWPNESRDPVECKWSGDPAGPAGMVLVLPEDFARSKQASQSPHVATEAKPAISQSQPRSHPPSPCSSYSFGDPPPGRSAEDQRKRAMR